MNSTDTAKVSRILQAAKTEITTYLSTAGTGYSKGDYDEFYETACLLLGNLQSNIDMMGKVGQNGNTKRKILEEPNVFEALTAASQMFLRPRCRCGNFYTKGNYISCKNKPVEVCGHCFEYYDFLQQILSELSSTHHTTNPRVICADTPKAMSACGTCCFENWACKCGLTDEQTTSNTQRKHLSTIAKKVFALK
jgi:hypothetical protein